MSGFLPYFVLFVYIKLHTFLDTLRLAGSRENVCSSIKASVFIPGGALYLKLEFADMAPAALASFGLVFTALSSIQLCLLPRSV